MDNQEQKEAGHELPQPVAGGETLPIPSDSAPAPQEQNNGGTGDPAAAAQAMAAAQSIAGTPSAQPPASATATSHMSAQDVDLIEKEWVQKAKDIVAHTMGDPYTQNKEINKIKADYIKKRYNKDIKQTNE